MGEGGAPPGPPPWRCPTGGSGSGWRRRNDVREERILWEQKTTGKPQYTIKEYDWENLRKNALLDGLIPMMHITLGTKKRRLIVMEEGDFEAAFLL